MAWVDASGGYVVVSAFYVAAAILLWSLRSPSGRVTPGQQSSPVRNLLEGLRYVRGNQAILATISITVLMNFLFFSYQQMVPVIAKDTLKVGEGLTGVLMAAEGTGAFLGAFVIASFVRLRHHGRLYTFGSLFALALLLFFSFSRWYGLSFPILVLMGLGVSGFATMQSTIVILVARDEMRGRALGVISLGIGAGPLGALMVGAVADRFSPGLAIGVDACIGLVLVLMVWLLMPALRRPLVPDEARQP
jgi:predicted MFS family arabinose efflux permease